MSNRSDRQLPDEVPISQRIIRLGKTKSISMQSDTSSVILPRTKMRIQRSNQHDELTDHPGYWWKGDPENIYLRIQRVIDMIYHATKSDRLLWIKYGRQYGNVDSTQQAFFQYAGNSAENFSSSRPALNVVQSCIDTANAKISKDQPKVQFLTCGADDYFLRRKAALLTKYVQGIFKETDLYAISENVFVNAAVYGTGFLKIFIDNNRLRAESCNVGELLIDQMDGMYGNPRSIHQVKALDRDLLIARFPDAQDIIMHASSQYRDRISQHTLTDFIKVFESWHLPSHEGADDGIHTITIPTGTLVCEPYDKLYFPIIPFRWQPNLLGFYGRSITQEIMSLQIEINKILQAIQQSIELQAVPTILLPNSAEVAENIILSNSIARLIPYNGEVPPSWVTPTGMNPEVYQHLDRLVEFCYQKTGLSQAAATGNKPAGVNSAVAIREVSDIETGRFAQVANRWEQLFVDAARIIVDLSADLYAELPDLKVTVSEEQIIKQISFKNVYLADNPFSIQAFPVSSLPDSPAGRLEMISEMQQAGLIDRDRSMELLNLDPDLDEEVNLQTSSLRLTEQYISDMVDNGEKAYHHPSPFMNLQESLALTVKMINNLELNSCPDDRLQLVRNFASEISDMLNPPAPPAPPPGAPPPGAPPPGAPPPPAPPQGPPPSEPTQPSPMGQ